MVTAGSRQSDREGSGQDRGGVTGAVFSLSRSWSIIQGHIYPHLLEAKERLLLFKVIR